jgi:hypothetical protein
MQRTAVRMVVLVLCVSAVTVTGMRAGVGPFDAQLSGRALQRQRELDFVASSLRYLTEDAWDDAAEWSRVMGILTAGGFSSDQLALAVYGLTKAPGDAGTMDRDTLVARVEVVRWVLAHVRAIEPQLRRDEVTIMRVEGVGRYIEIDGRTYSGDEAEAKYPEITRRLSITDRWDDLEARVNALEQAIADLPESTD